MKMPRSGCKVVDTMRSTFMLSMICVTAGLLVAPVPPVHARACVRRELAGPMMQEEPRDGDEDGDGKEPSEQQQQSNPLARFINGPLFLPAAFLIGFGLPVGMSTQNPDIFQASTKDEVRFERAQERALASPQVDQELYHRAPTTMLPAGTFAADLSRRCARRYSKLPKTF